jgi:hypothetical protein
MKNRSSIEIFATILSVLACFAFSTRMQGAPDVTPPPDGCYPGFTTAEGCNALLHLSGGAGNTGVGWYSLFSAGGANYNTGVGAGTLVLTSGAGSDSNTAVGAAALLLNTTGNLNTAVGTDAMVYNDDGFYNGAVGAFALENNTDGYSNNAFGESALFSNQIGAANTAVGDVALAFNDSSGLGLGNNNVAVGAGALVASDGLSGNVDGSENTAVGTGAGPNLVSGFNNTYVGNFVGTEADDEDSTIRIGDLSNGNGAGSLDCYIGGIFNNVQPVGGSVVVVTLDLNDDHLGYDPGVARGGTAPVQRSVPLRRSGPGTPTRPAMLHGKVGKVEKLEATVAQQQKQIETLTTQLKEQAAQIQKVSAQLEMAKPATKVVLGNE